ncbi:MAG: Sensor histidine kinase RcsC [Syntrophus sp. SKADARSKE-3]|nr:Sensor histidine kinase RcsC [Syntrophus sp. SKADARSKE-3]
MDKTRSTLLVVDDDSANIDTLLGALKEEYNVRVAIDGATALNSVKKNLPDMILLDVMMPGIDGFEVCRLLKDDSATRNIPIIFLTALTTHADEAKCFSLGAVDYITKPFNLAIVRARIHNHLELKRHQNHLEAMVIERTRDLAEAHNRKTESLSRMAGAIAHHFNNKLNVVLGNLELAIMELEQGTIPHARISAAVKASTMAAEMSSLMLTYLGQSFDKHEMLDLSGLCYQSLPMLQTNGAVNVILETDLPLPGPIILANANQIVQILSNLITNAWEAGESGDVIRLSVKTLFAENIPTAHRFPLDWQPQSNAYACLELTDSGCGIESKDIENLFDPFFSSKFPGRGMGLAVVMGIVRNHGGVVAVESEPGQGSTFRVFFPVSGEVMVEHLNNTEHQNRESLFSAKLSEDMDAGGTMLLAEDDEHIRNMLWPCSSVWAIRCLKQKMLLRQ